ncbi:hypothetical protein [Streptococcus suis]|uniref:Uncharacterized protein n=1 Tax=Streptococcus suis TaxID=1307 RepID=A0A822VZC1_STRSU|nr:hypothetical protein [Streptococcus suis]MCG9864884.1 hypothetical protein [Streptococcus suis]MCG9889354.1 hypothetical protein [Streptococcus suis]MCG9903046.1 hypothetical protein [Streptococcus suis]MCG9913088.1 hypothetical protein [Streptococcus suis]MCG9921654.1 hypothetical protein [Streptococcus suis]
MIKEYRDRQHGLNAIDQLNNDIKNNPGIVFEIVGYQNTVIKTDYNLLVTSILVRWETFF